MRGSESAALNWLYNIFVEGGSRKIKMAVLGGCANFTDVHKTAISVHHIEYCPLSSLLRPPKARRFVIASGKQINRILLTFVFNCINLN